MDRVAQLFVDTSFNGSGGESWLNERSTSIFLKKTRKLAM